MNRVTRMLHKASFIARQRKSFDYFRKYVVTDRDIKIADLKEKQKKSRDMTKKVDIIELLVDGFDPERSQTDRHILYEVTGLRLIDDEFMDDDSSDVEPNFDSSAI